LEKSLGNGLENNKPATIDRGVYIATYRGKPNYTISIILLSFLLLAVLTSIWAGLWITGYSYSNYGFISALNKLQISLFLFVFFFIIIIIFFFLLLNKSYPMIDLYTKGFFIKTNIINRQLITWNNITGVSENYIQKVFMGSTLQNCYSSTIYIRHRKPIHLNCSINYLSEFINMLKINISPLLMPKMQLKYKSGELITFGSIGLKKGQIIINANKLKFQKQFIHLTDLKKISVHNGKLMILEKNTKHVHYIKVSDIINLPLFLQLVGEITK